MNAANLLAAGLALFVTLAPIPPVWPRRFASFLRATALSVGLAAALFDISLFPMSLPVFWGLIFVIAMLALAAPVAGLIGSHRSGALTYRPESGRTTPSEIRKRFALHLTSNLLGLIFTICVSVHTRTLLTNGVTPPPAAFVDLGLPLAVMAVLSFVSATQLRVAPEISGGSPHQVEDLAGVSLSEAHQQINVVYLVLATFLAGASVLTSVAHSMALARANNPETLTIGLLAVPVLFIVFLFACSISRMPTVFATFAFGVPISLVATIWWLLLMRPDPLRTIALVVFGALGMTAYPLLMRRWLRSPGRDRLQFSDGANVVLLGAALAAMLAATYWDM